MTCRPARALALAAVVAASLAIAACSPPPVAFDAGDGAGADEDAGAGDDAGPGFDGGPGFFVDGGSGFDGGGFLLDGGGSGFDGSSLFDGGGATLDAGRVDDDDDPAGDAGPALPLDGGDEPVDDGFGDGGDDGDDDDAGVVDAGSAGDAGPAPRIQAFFNVPQGDVRDTTLEDLVVELVGRALPGSSIRVSLFNLTRMRTANAFVAAHAAGVDVRLVLDGNNATNAAYGVLTAGLPADRITLCDSASGSACIGSRINHSKFYLFSALDDGSTNVVVQSSANLTTPMLTEHNNIVVVRDDPALYQGYLAVWQDQRIGATDLDYYTTVVGVRPVRTYFFPRAAGDTILSVLDNVVCTGGGTIRVGMSLFTNGRVAIAEALAQKTDDGCTVLAVLRDDDESPGSAIVPALQAGGVDVKLLSQTTARSTIHSKYLLIDAPYDTGSGPTPRKLVFTGSHNYTVGALRENDEQLMRIDDPTVFAAFVANFTAIRATAP